MSENRIKSAWEIALEKAEKLGKLSPEETRKRLEKEFYPRGKALALKYLKGLPARDLEKELNQFFNEQEKNMVKRGFIDTLVAEISLEEVKNSVRALEGILAVSKDSSLTNTGEKITALLDKYHQEKDILYSSLEQTIAKKLEQQLKQEGIAGSAIRVNVPATAEWQEALAKLDTTNRGGLEHLKKELFKPIASRE